MKKQAGKHTYCSVFNVSALVAIEVIQLNQLYNLKLY